MKPSTGSSCAAGDRGLGSVDVGENRMKLDIEFNRITFEPGKMGGRACIRGLRITVGLVVSLVAEGVPWEEILNDYPDLGPEDIRQSLAYAAWLTREEIIPA